MRRRGIPRARLIGLVVAASLLTACTPSVPPEGVHATPVASTVVRPTPTVDVPVAAATPPPLPPPVAAPVELRIAAIDAVLPVRAVGVQEDGSMQIPADPAVAGWYRYGPVPGAVQGSSVIAAHVDSRVRGIGPLAQLRGLAPGSRVEVIDEAGESTSFEVDTVTYIPRDSLPVDRFFARDGDPALVIITCGGSFDEATRSYSDNVVAIARPVS